MKKKDDLVIEMSYEEFKKKLPVNMDELMKVEGLGPKKVKVLYQKLGVKKSMV